MKKIKSKYLIYTGILLLIAGIILKVLDLQSVVALVLIISGAILKISYLIVKLFYGSYKAGYELLFLFIGLALFFLGKYSEISFVSRYALIFMIIGIALKFTFVLLFILKLKRQRISE